MTVTLLDQFLEEECTAHVRGLLKESLEAGRAGVGPRSRRFEFNRFEITFDLDAGEVLIEDVLDATGAGAERVSLADFSGALK